MSIFVLVDPEDEGVTVLCNVQNYSPQDTASLSGTTPLWEVPVLHSQSSLHRTVLCCSVVG